jgi:hypothetical protein
VDISAAADGSKEGEYDGVDGGVCRGRVVLKRCWKNLGRLEFDTGDTRREEGGC